MANDAFASKKPSMQTHEARSVEFVSSVTALSGQSRHAVAKSLFSSGLYVPWGHAKHALALAQANAGERSQALKTLSKIVEMLAATSTQCSKGRLASMRSSLPTFSWLEWSA